MTIGVPSIMIPYKIVGHEILLDYERLTEKCLWSIFDLGGVEICKGTLSGSPPHRISLKQLPPNVYQLCVIDGDKLLNTRFRVS